MTAPALRYWRRGLSVIPLRPGSKYPLISWREFQTRRPTEAEVREWFQRWPDAGIAIVCGAVSGIAVLDFDPRDGNARPLADRLPPTPTAETGGGGRHYYFSLAPGERVAKIPRLLPGVDLQGEASIVVAPPSVHPSGRPYRWVPGRALGEIPLAPFPIPLRFVTMRSEPGGEHVPSGCGRATALVLDGVLSRLQGVRQCGRGWIAFCPAHDDHEPSLSVGVGAGGRTLLHCFAGCSFIEIVSALNGR